MNCELTPTDRTGLVAYYKFNEGDATANNSIVTTAIDSSGNGNNGTLTNFALTGTTSNWVSPGAVASGVSCGSIVYPTVSVNSPTICIGTTATLTASGANTYTWSTNATTASIAATPTVSVSYSVSGTSASGCLSANTATAMVTVNACGTGIEKYSGSIDVNIYPNPNNGTFAITTTANTQTILVTDVLGNELLSVSPNGTTTNIDLTAQPSGVYFIKVIANGAQTVKRIIINN